MDLCLSVTDSWGVCGELNELLPPPDALPDGMTPHGLLWIDCFWGHSPEEGKPFNKTIRSPRFGLEEMTDWVKGYRTAGGGCTVNIGIYRDGILAGPSVDLLAGLSRALGAEVKH